MSYTIDDFKFDTLRLMLTDPWLSTSRARTITSGLPACPTAP